MPLTIPEVVRRLDRRSGGPPENIRGASLRVRRAQRLFESRLLRDGSLIGGAACSVVLPHGCFRIRCRFQPLNIAVTLIDRVRGAMACFRQLNTRDGQPTPGDPR